MKPSADLAKFLRKKRLESGLSQLEVGHRLGYTTAQFISNWERGVSSPPLDKLAAITDMYGISKKEMVSILLAVTKREIEKHLSAGGHRRKGA